MTTTTTKHVHLNESEVLHMLDDLRDGTIGSGPYSAQTGILEKCHECKACQAFYAKVENNFDCGHYDNPETYGVDWDKLNDKPLVSRFVDGVKPVRAVAKLSLWDYLSDLRVVVALWSFSGLLVLVHFVH